MATCKNSYTDYETSLGNHSVLKITTARKKEYKVVVDTSMVNELKQHKWFVDERHQRIIDEDGVNIRHVIYGEPAEGNFVTTRNRDYLDNRARNLVEVKGHKGLAEKNTIYKNNKVGTKGVYETKYYYVAHIKRGYEVRKAFFSKNQLGEKEALRRAKAQRLSWQRELDKNSF